MQGKTVALIWVVGLALAFGLYATGPERFFVTLVDGFDEIIWRVQDTLYLFGSKTFDVVRALAIALFVVFFALGVIAAQRGIKARGALTLVSALFLILLAGPGSGTPIHPSRWTEAFVLSAVASVVMTQRLMRHR
jgi:hypothetical protein